MSKISCNKLIICYYSVLCFSQKRLGKEPNAKKELNECFANWVRFKFLFYSLLSLNGKSVSSLPPHVVG